MGNTWPLKQTPSIGAITFLRRPETLRPPLRARGAALWGRARHRRMCRLKAVVLHPRNLLRRGRCNFVHCLTDHETIAPRARSAEASSRRRYNFAWCPSSASRTPRRSCGFPCDPRSKEAHADTWLAGGTADHDTGGTLNLPPSGDVRLDHGGATSSKFHEYAPGARRERHFD